MLKEALKTKSRQTVRLLIERDSGSITLLKTRLVWVTPEPAGWWNKCVKRASLVKPRGGVASDILIDLAGWEDMKKLMQAKDRSSMLAEYPTKVKKTSTVRTGSPKKRNNRSNAPLFGTAAPKISEGELSRRTSLATGEPDGDERRNP